MQNRKQDGPAGSADGFTVAEICIALIILFAAFCGLAVSAAWTYAGLNRGAQRNGQMTNATP